jgi:MtrB/PioB family decaheme-associated outer membrane protein
MMKTMKKHVTPAAAKASCLPRQKVLAVCVGALFLLPSGAALAQSSFGNSAVGVDLSLGNSLNMPGRGGNPLPTTADDGYDTVRHTPTGQLYNLPPDRTYELGNKTESGWLYSGSVELGFLGGGPNAKYAKYIEYHDFKKGLGLNWFDFQLENPESAFYLNFSGANPGQDDQFYDLQFGKYNDWRVRAFYNEIPHVFSTTYRTTFERSGDLLYRVRAANATVANDDIGLVRKRMGVRGDYTVVDSWRFFATATTEKREGRRPFNYEASAAADAGEWIDHRTSDFSVGLQYFKNNTAFNLRTSLSIFENDFSTFLFDNTAGGVGATARYTIAPDNKNVSIKGDAMHQWDFWSTRLTGGFSWSSSTQDDRVNPPTEPRLVPGATNSNGLNGCPNLRCHSDLRIDSTMFNLALSTEPIDSLTLRFGARYQDNDNKSGNWSTWNPLLNGFMPSNLEATNTAAPGYTVAAGNVALAWGRSIIGFARSERQVNYTASAEYLFDKQSIDFTYERENFKLENYERENTHEDKFKLTYTGRNFFDQVTVRSSFEHDRKRGDYYDPFGGVSRSTVASYMEANGIPYSMSNLKRLLDLVGAAGNLAGLVPYNGAAFTRTAIQNLITNAQFQPSTYQKPYLADRDQNIFNGRIGYSPREDVDLGFSMQLARLNYPENEFGPKKSRVDSFNFDANWQLSSETQLGAWVSRQNQKDDGQESYLARTAPQITSICGAFGSATIECWIDNTRDPNNPENSPKIATRTKTNALGLTLTHDFRWARLGMSYTYTKGNTSIKHSNEGSGSTTQNFNIPDMVTRMDTLEINLVKDFTKNLTGRLMYRVDSFQNKDWHYDYATNAGNTTGNNLSDLGPENFRINVFGAFVQYKF